jgi:hypothetical protein
MDGWMDRWMDVWMNGQMDEWIIGQMDGWLAGVSLNKNLQEDDVVCSLELHNVRGFVA